MHEEKSQPIYQTFLCFDTLYQERWVSPPLSHSQEKLKSLQWNKCTLKSWRIYVFLPPYCTRLMIRLMCKLQRCSYMERCCFWFCFNYNMFLTLFLNSLFTLFPKLEVKWLLLLGTDNKSTASVFATPPSFY